MTAGALSDLTVLDLAQDVGGSYCGKLLAGFGADTIKIEPPGSGDPTRGRGPFHEDRPGLDRSIPFLWLNTAKKSVTLDLETGVGRRLLDRLATSADVLVHSHVPDRAEALGLDHDRLAAINPRLVVTAVTGFGGSGPYRDYQATEAVINAMSGQMYLQGDPSREPLACGPEVAAYTAGHHAYLGTLMALYHVRAGGSGQLVEISAHESGVDCIELAMIAALWDDKRGRRNRHPMVPWDIYPAKDGWAMVLCGPFRHWVGGADLFRAPELLEERFHHVLGRVPHYEEIEAMVKPWIASQTKRDVFHAGQARRLAFGFLATLSEVMQLTQHRGRDFFAAIEHPEVGTHPYCGAPFKLSEDPWVDGPAPLLGEHNRSVLREWLATSDQELAELAASGVHA